MKNELLKKCYQISPQAKEFVLSSSPNDISVLFDSDEEMILMVKLEDFLIMYAYSIKETPSYLSVIKKLVKSNYQIEWCFNVSLQATKTRTILLENDFILDMAGYQMKRKTECLDFPNNNLIFQPYQDSNFSETKALMKLSYCPLLIPESRFSIPETYFQKSNTIQTLLFYSKNQLIGFVCIDQNYIRDFAIHPNHQNKGYGKEMLVKTLQYMSVYTKEVYLRVAENNLSAMHLYEKMGFTKISAFAEHTKKQT